VTPGPFRFEFPPLPEYLGTARAFVAAAARELETSEETVADLELAVSEACTIAISSGEPVRVRVSATGSALEVEVDLPSGGDRLEGSDDLEGRELIASLFPDAGPVAGAYGAPVFRFVVPLG
jgi:hypothetical protein